MTRPVASRSSRADGSLERARPETIHRSRYRSAFRTGPAGRCARRNRTVGGLQGLSHRPPARQFRASVPLGRRPHPEAAAPRRPGSSGPRRAVRRDYPACASAHEAPDRTGLHPPPGGGGGSVVEPCPRTGPWRPEFVHSAQVNPNLVPTGPRSALRSALGTQGRPLPTNSTLARRATRRTFSPAPAAPPPSSQPTDPHREVQGS